LQYSGRPRTVNEMQKMMRRLSCGALSAGLDLAGKARTNAVGILLVNALDIP